MKGVPSLDAISIALSRHAARLAARPRVVDPDDGHIEADARTLRLAPSHAGHIVLSRLRHSTEGMGMLHVELPHDQASAKGTAMLDEMDAVLRRASQLDAAGASTGSPPAWSLVADEATLSLAATLGDPIRILLNARSSWTTSGRGHHSALALDGDMKGTVFRIAGRVHLKLERRPRGGPRPGAWGYDDFTTRRPRLDLVSAAPLPATVIAGAAGKRLGTILAMTGMPPESRIHEMECAADASGLHHVHATIDRHMVPLEPPPPGVDVSWLQTDWKGFTPWQ